MAYARIDFAAAPISMRVDPGTDVEEEHRIPRTRYHSSSELAMMESNAPMTCPSCYWQHTDVNTALICYRKSNPVPAQSPTRGDIENAEQIPRPEDGSEGVDSALLKGHASLSTNSGLSKTVFRHGRRGKVGRPPVPAAEQRRKARERSRQYRDRQKKQELAATATAD
jgi:hypothetical protein